MKIVLILFLLVVSPACSRDWVRRRARQAYRNGPPPGYHGAMPPAQGQMGRGGGFQQQGQGPPPGQFPPPPGQFPGQPQHGPPRQGQGPPGQFQGSPQGHGRQGFPPQGGGFQNQGQGFRGGQGQGGGQFRPGGGVPRVGDAEYPNYILSLNPNDPARIQYEKSEMERIKALEKRVDEIPVVVKETMEEVLEEEAEAVENDLANDPAYELPVQAHRKGSASNHRFAITSITTTLLLVIVHFLV